MAVTHILPGLIKALRNLEEEIEGAERKLLSMTEEKPLFKVLKSFGGIGDGIAMHLTAEMGDISSYATPQKLVAACGLDPSREQSGSSIDRYGKVTKAGNRYARHWLFNAVSCVVMQAARGKGDTAVADYYKKKHSDEKHHHYAATVACCNKLIRRIFYRFQDFAKTGELIVE